MLAVGHVDAPRSYDSVDMPDVRVLRVYHAGRSEAHRARDRALVALGASVTLVVPAAWAGPENTENAVEPGLRLIELDVIRAGDVNRHRYREPSMLERVIADVRPDVLDVHEEPFSLAARQWLSAAPPELPIVMYTAQNIDKRFPPPFSGYERAALRRVVCLYPCSGQAASVARRKGFAGIIRVIPLGVDAALYRPGKQSLDDPEVVLGLFGRLVPEKGVQEAIHVLAHVLKVRPARLILVGEGPEARVALALARRLGVDQRVVVVSGSSPQEVAAHYRSVHVLLVPSIATTTWAEQFGRVIVEAQASGAVVAGYASGAIPEVAGPPAVVVPEGNLDALAETVGSLVGSVDEWMRRRSAGLTLAEHRTWDRVAAEQLCLYREALVAPPRASLPRSRVEQQRAASAEFGAPAVTPAGTRPFAYRPLRKGGTLAVLLGAAIDRAEVVGTRLLPRR